jgi:signal transduction histidine kinase
MNHKLLFGSPVRFALGIALVIILAVFIFTWLMRPSQEDTSQMVIFLSITALISLVVGYGATRLGWINQSPRLQISLIIGYAISSFLTFINVWITARLMFASQHDLLLATVLLLFASGIAMILGGFFAGTLVERLGRLNQAAQQIASGQFSVRVPPEGRDELAELAASFNAMASQLELAEHKKKEIDTLRTDLVAWVSHDLQTPLASIRAIVEALADGLVDDPDTTRRYLNTAKKDIQSLSSLIDDLFQMAQLDAGGLKLDLAEGSITDLISDTIESFSELAKRQNINLDGKVDPGLDPVYMDARRIGRVLTNLVGNAIRYTHAGGSVFIQACAQNSDILVEIIDTGSGIPSGDLPHIFERFYRGEKSRSRSSGGAGLGLAIARGIVEAHGGEIGADSQPGAGARLFFTLPASSTRSK